MASLAVEADAAVRSNDTHAARRLLAQLIELCERALAGPTADRDGR